MKIYMIGIGGIGMSALAQLYLARGDEVSGSDRESGPTTEMLEKLGIQISYGQKVAKMPGDTDLVIYSDAIPESHVERAQARELRKNQKSYFEALGDVSRKMTAIAVSGTHGKTTTTAMLTKILKDGGKNPTAVIGSLIKDFGSNFVSGDPQLFVVEACEYRDHLLELSPKILIITNVEWDHTDWFHTESDMVATFHKAALKVPADGYIVANVGGKNMSAVLDGVAATVVDYTKEDVPELKLIGEFNKMNARAAIAAAKAFAPDLANTIIYDSVSSFQGSWRRFEYKGRSKTGAEVYDDYAHHPTAVRETIHGIRQKFPGKKVVVAFHPHLYSRTRDLMAEFARAFDGADRVLLAPIYAAREAPLEGVSSEVLEARIAAERPGLAAALPTFDTIQETLERESDPDTIIVTMGAGDIYKVADRLVA